MEPGVCLETNLYSIATAKASELGERDRNPAVFEFLFDAIKPSVVYVHSNAPIRFIQEPTG